MKTNWFMTTDMENMAGTNYNKTFLVWLLQKMLNITNIFFNLISKFLHIIFNPAGNNKLQFCEAITEIS